MHSRTGESQAEQIEWDAYFNWYIETYKKLMKKRQKTPRQLLVLTHDISKISSSEHLPRNQCFNCNLLGYWRRNCS